MLRMGWLVSDVDGKEEDLGGRVSGRKKRKTRVSQHFIDGSSSSPCSSHEEGAGHSDDDRRNGWRLGTERAIC